MIREEEIAALKAKLRAREGKPGYAKNCEMIRERLAKLEGADGL